jgi:hypothetical protein
LRERITCEWAYPLNIAVIAPVQTLDEQRDDAGRRSVAIALAVETPPRRMRTASAIVPRNIGTATIATRSTSASVPRRSAVVNMCRAGVPRHVAKQISGHVTDSVFRRYAISDVSDMRAGLTQTEAYQKRAAKQQPVAMAQQLYSDREVKGGAFTVPPFFCLQAIQRGTKSRASKKWFTVALKLCILDRGKTAKLLYCRRRAVSSAVRASGLHPEGPLFKSVTAHHLWRIRGDVVQLVRTLPCHGRGREFESRRPRHSSQSLESVASAQAADL